MQIFSFNLDIIPNGRIDVTWTDIIDKINSEIVLPTEEVLDSIGYYGDYYG